VHGLKLEFSDEFGMPAQYKEAIKFATLAFANKRSLANNIPAAGGAESYAVLGKFTYAPRRAKNAEPVTRGRTFFPLSIAWLMRLADMLKAAGHVRYKDVLTTNGVNGH
jgi:hypothetical protein